MYNIIKNVIISGRYELKDILTKIDTLWVQSTITDTERTELIDLARTHSTPDMGYAPLQNQIDDLKTEINELKSQVRALQNVDVPDVDEAEPDEYPQYKQPTGAHDAYYTGDKMTYNDVRYICIAPDGYGVAYPPDILPGMWQTVE